MDFLYFLLALALIGISGFFGVKKIISNIKKKKDLNRSLSLIFLHLAFPIKDSKEDKEKEAESIGGNAGFKETIDVMSQFYENLYSVYQGDFWNKYFGEDFFSFEMTIIEKELHFYVVIPKEMRELFEKRISAFYPDVFIDVVKDYNIFKEGSKYATKAFTLKKENYFPLKTYQETASDPINTLINAMSKMEEDEGAAVQLVLSPVGDGWQKEGRKKAKDILEGKEDKKKSSFLSYFNPINFIKFFFKIMTSDGEEKDEGGGRVTQATEEMVKQMEEKNTKIGFNAVLRVVTSASTKESAKENLNIISTAFDTLSDPETNSFSSVKSLDEFNLLAFSMRNLDLEQKFFKKKVEPMILYSKEISSILHFPNIKFNKSLVIKWQEFKIAPAPSDLPNEGVILGTNSYRGVDRDIRIYRNDRRRHFYLIGKSGTGKSTLIETLVRQDLANGDGVCVIDPHGDLVEGLLPYVPRHRADDVIVFDPGDLERPMGLNVLEAEGEDKKEFMAQEALAIFIKLFGEEIMGPRLQHYFRNGALTLMADDEDGATILDLPRLFTDDAFQQYKSAKVTNPEVRSFWDKEMAASGDREKQEIIPYFSSKFGPFKTNAQIRNIIGQPRSGFDFRKVMDEQKILLVNLSKGKLGELNSKLVGMIMVAKLQMAAMSRVDTPEADRHDFYMYVDEFQNFVTDSFASILSEARKYRLNLIIAHQYISQITKMNSGGKGTVDDTSIRDAVFGNVGSMMCFKIGAADAETMAKEFAPVFSEQDLVNIANYNAYIKLNINGTTSRGFSMKTIYDPSGSDKQAAEAYKQLSRLKFARKRDFVEKEIMRRIGN